MASNSPGKYPRSHHMTDFHGRQMINDLIPDISGTLGGFTMGMTSGYAPFVPKDSGYNVSTSDGASTCSSSTTEPGELDAGALLFLEPKSLRSFTTNDEYLLAMKEDLADWFSSLYQNYDITAENFFHVLETGVLLCKHANKVQECARQQKEMGESLEMKSYFIRSVPETSIPFREGVKPETFQARDNVSNFITWTRQLGIPEVLSFETDDLVLRKNEKSVILCLLEVARVGAKLGMLAPTLVQMEQEIDAELAGEEPKPWVQIKTCDMRSLDERVRDLIGRCTCPIQFPMIKVGEGKYKIGDTRSLIFVRILRNHVMVRVGGGWDTLENYLDKHDPCQCNYRGHRASTGGFAHKMAVNQQQRSPNPSTSTTRSTAKTSRSQRQEPSASPDSRNSSLSPQISRTSSPTLVIPHHIPVPPKSDISLNKPSKKATIMPSQIHEECIAKALFHQSPSGSLSSQPIESVSPGRLRSSSPLVISEDIPATSSTRTPVSAVPLRGRGRSKKNKSLPPVESLTASSGRSALLDEAEQHSPARTRSSSSSLDRPYESDTAINVGEGTTITTEFRPLPSSTHPLPTDQSVHIKLWGGKSLGELYENDSLYTCVSGQKTYSVHCPLSPEDCNRQTVIKDTGPDTERKAKRKSLPQFSNVDISSELDTSRPDAPRLQQRILDATEETTLSHPTVTASSERKIPISSHEQQIVSDLNRTSKIGYNIVDSKQDALTKIDGEISDWEKSKNGLEFAGKSSKPTKPNSLLTSYKNVPQTVLNKQKDDTLPKPVAQTLNSTAKERPITPSRIPKPQVSRYSTTPRTPSPLYNEITRSDNDTISTEVSQKDLSRINTDFNSMTDLSSISTVTVSRSNNNPKIKYLDKTLLSPASMCSDDKSLRVVKSPALSSLSTANGNSIKNKGDGHRKSDNVKRTIKPGSHVRNPAVSDVRQKYVIGGSSSILSASGNKTLTSTRQRRHSIDTISQTDKLTMQKTTSKLQHTADVEKNPVIINEITFSDDEEINDLIKNSALKVKSPNTTKQFTSTSPDKRNILHRKENEDVLMISRDSSGRHEVQLAKKNMTSRSLPKSRIVSRQSPLGGSVDQLYSGPHISRTGSKFNPTSIKKREVPKNKRPHETKPVEPASHPGTNTTNVTEDWVDSTLPENKIKPQTHKEVMKAIRSEIPTTQLATQLSPVSLAEIQALILKNGFIHVSPEVLESPQEDPEMYKEMEKLYEMYREMELKSSVKKISFSGGRKLSPDQVCDSKSTRSVVPVTCNKISAASITSFSDFSLVPTGNDLTTDRASSHETKNFIKYPNTLIFTQERSSSVKLTDFSQEAQDYFNSGICQNSETFKDPLHNSGSGKAKTQAVLISKIQEIFTCHTHKDDNMRDVFCIQAQVSPKKLRRSMSETFLYSNDMSSNDGNHKYDTNTTHDCESVLLYSNSSSNSESQYLRKSSSLPSISYSEYI